MSLSNNTSSMSENKAEVNMRSTYQWRLLGLVEIPF